MCLVPPDPRSAQPSERGAQLPSSVSKGAARPSSFALPATGAPPFARGAASPSSLPALLPGRRTSVGRAGAAAALSPRRAHDYG
eukprot:scaffold320_cov362-Prasinococcus_capsulatus_cf.AAC.1